MSEGWQGTMEITRRDLMQTWVGRAIVRTEPMPWFATVVLDGTEEQLAAALALSGVPVGVLLHDKPLHTADGIVDPPSSSTSGPLRVHLTISGTTEFEPPFSS